MAFYVDGSPHITRSPTTALNCALFRRVSGLVSSETVLAHVRKATQGVPSVLNCHPFQHGRWTFAHNGDIPGFGRCREALMAHVAPRLRRYVLGDTDSEVVFFVFLSQVALRGPLTGPMSAEDIAAALGATTALVRSISTEGKALLTFIVTDGVTMAAHQGGKELFFSTYKTRCGDRETCPSLSPECEAPTTSGFVNHLLFSSEPIHGENVWHPLEEGEIVAVDGRMHLLRASSRRRLLPVATRA